MANKKLKLALHELEQEMEVITQEEMKSLKGGLGGCSYDDIKLGEYQAHNNVTSNSRGEWSSGIFHFIDRNNSFHHGGQKDRYGIPLDSSSGAYGSSGIFRVEPFYDENGKYREGMGVHSGRDYKPFEERKTLGCIRTVDEAMQMIEKQLREGNTLGYIEFRD